MLSPKEAFIRGSWAIRSIDKTDPDIIEAIVRLREVTHPSVIDAAQSLVHALKEQDQSDRLKGLDEVAHRLMDSPDTYQAGAKLMLKAAAIMLERPPINPPPSTTKEDL